MIKLISNENAKIYQRLRTWIMVGLIMVATILIAVILHSHQHATADWRSSLIQQNAQIQQQINKSKGHLPSSYMAQLQQSLLTNNYYLKHNLDPNLTNAWAFATTAQNLSTLLIAFIVVVAGDIVAFEFGSGTIKMLLTQTATRTRVLMAKYASALLYGLFMTVVMFVFSIVVGWVFFGATGAGLPHIYVDTHHQIRSMTAAQYLMMQYGFLLIKMVMIVTIAFMISAIFRSSALAITISLLAFIVGSTIVQALSSYSWSKYILFANTDLSQYVINGPSISGMTLQFSIIMLVIYFFVMNLLAWIFFVKRDVAYT